MGTESKKDKGYLKNTVTFIFCDKFSYRNFKRLFERNSSIVHVDIDDFCKNIEINFLVENTIIKSGKYDIDHMKRSKILYYPYSFESIFFDPIKYDSSYRFAKRQYAALIKFIEYWLETTNYVIDKPSVSQIWSNKLYQLEKIAQNLPEYKLDSDLRQSYLQIESGKVIKHISECRIIDKQNVSFSLRVTDQIIEELSKGVSLPFIYQEFINDNCEYRCYVFGDNLILLNFSRNAMRDDSIDIHSDKYSIKNPSIVPILEIHLKMIRRIKSIMNINIFAVDFFCINNLEIKILEVNPIPSWYWLSSGIRGKIDDALSLNF